MFTDEIIQEISNLKERVTKLENKNSNSKSVPLKRMSVEEVASLLHFEPINNERAVKVIRSSKCREPISLSINEVIDMLNFLR